MGIVAIFLQYLPQLVQAAKTIPEIIGFIQRTKATLETTEEWTAAEQAAYDREVETITSQPHWKSDESPQPSA